MAACEGDGMRRVAERKAALRSALSRALTTALALLPLLCVGLGVVGGWSLALVGALIGPAMLVGLSRLPERSTAPAPAARAADPRDALCAALRDTLARTGADRARTACLLLHADRLGDSAGQTETQIVNGALEQIGARLSAGLRGGDMVIRLDGPRFGVVLDPGGGPADLEGLMQIAARLHRAATDPITVGPARLRPTASLGLCSADSLASPAAADILDGAETALMEARAAGGGAMRVFAPAMQARREARESLVTDAARALEDGEITAWFQPQISTHTGRVTGFEALARWDHPARGTVAPGDFLPALDAAGLCERLGEVMVERALRALASWDATGAEVPGVGVNLGQADLDNPRLAERIAWQIDRFDLDPGRLTIEVLESVVAAAPGDATSRNIATLAGMGCHIDLDDFGTGHASITTLRRLRIDRIKIDRSFVAGVDSDRDQQKMVTTILAMCEHLGLDTLAEGVETPDEHAMLAQLGCGHVQGYAIGRPMPFAETAGWLQAHAARLGPGPELRRRSR
jgi:EAL domain-containing protein (putative c-di-GMP-specific phosphodiesterase class I)/GGDEF domain-containing protein